jgi:hypothetical protein
MYDCIRMYYKCNIGYESGLSAKRVELKYATDSSLFNKKKYYF